MLESDLRDTLASGLRWGSQARAPVLNPGRMREIPEVEAVADSKSAMKAFVHSDPDLLIPDVDLGSRPNGVELTFGTAANGTGNCVVRATKALDGSYSSQVT